MKISKIHQRFANRVGQEALTNPEPFLGPNYKTVLNFWYYLDTLTEDQINVAFVRYDAIPYEPSVSRDLVRYAARDVVGETNRSAVYMASFDFSASYATYELIAMHKLLEQGKKLIFVPLFDSL